jgi:N-acetylmuramoyl-L-alanine amidase
VRQAPASPSLQKARAQLASLVRTPSKRRYRHNWEKVIRNLERSARGSDRGPALLDAARARYALYRFSAIERDREQALVLAGKATRAGEPKAAVLAAAIRREAGDDEPRPPRARPARPPAAPPSPSPAAVPEPVAAGDEQEASDPVLEEAVAELESAGAAPGAAPAPAPERAEGPAQVSEVRTWSASDYTRVALYLSRPVSFEKHELPATADLPRRLALDLRPALLDGKAFRHPVGDALLERVRAAQRDPETVRVVLDLATRDRYQLFTLQDPPRLIVDVGARGSQEEAVADRHAPALPAPEAPPVDDEGEGAARRPIRRIIVDAGHGGHDTGAIGPRGVREKDVTLAMAHRVARKLRAAGFEVFLTRSDDRYLRLEERTAIANVNRGDLFVSIHANAHPRRERRGVETYFLNVTDDRYARRLAARENGFVEPEAEGPGVQRILTDLDAKASAGTSRRLAQMIQRELTERVRRTHGEVRDLGVKNALFYVLLGARMPAVLVETAFISNRAEERRLASPEYQQLVADGVARAVSDFAGTGSRLAAR